MLDYRDNSLYYTSAYISQYVMVYKNKTIEKVEFYTSSNDIISRIASNNDNKNDFVISAIDNPITTIGIPRGYTISNKNNILSNLEEIIKEEKELNNIEPNKLSLKQMKKILSSYDKCFKYLPRVVLYPNTKDLGLAWTVKRGYYANLFFIKNEKILYLIDFPNKEKRGTVLSDIKNFNETILIIEDEIAGI
ncbi:MAG TPA: hypothetical protein VLL98_04105 [Rickettsiales bacterium]|nr:hypothetical protein [Rickettsiales bacterium]